MSNLTESLTVRILADGSEFNRELDQALERLRRFNQQMQELGRAQSGLAGLAGGLQRLSQPLSQVSSLLTRVTQQVRQLSETPVQLNVAPALQALSQLSAAIQRVAGQLSGLSGGGAAGGGGARLAGGLMAGLLGGPGPSGMPGGGSVGGETPPRRLHQGGLVTGPGGLDRVPALLSAGEFVLSRSAVEELGSARLELLNQGVKGLRGRELTEQAGSPEIHQYGEISIHVTQPVALGEMLRDLQFEGHRLRNRRG